MNTGPQTYTNNTTSYVDDAFWGYTDTYIYI